MNRFEDEVATLAKYEAIHRRCVDIKDPHDRALAIIHELNSLSLRELEYIAEYIRQ